MNLHHLTRRRRGPTVAQVAVVLGLGIGLVACARALRSGRRSVPRGSHDYSNRRGLPLPPEEMRGAALLDFCIPDDMRTPLALRPLVTT
ncbi:MAG TPA: hypothetical protein VGP22_01615 [Albitalea sp.]|jgi:hypothetical protein|nr:hypothetical protein [Albitalea sp.]